MVKQKIELMVAGVGGQGLLTTGWLFAEAAMPNYKHVLYFPNYGPMMRGGESECTVILSNEEIGSPVVYNPASAIVMGKVALTRLEGRLKSGGTMFVDSSVVPDRVSREDITVFYIPATRMAIDLGDRRVANLVLLGAYLEATKVLPLEAIETHLEKQLAGKKGEAILKFNKQALREGAKLIAEYQH